MAEPGPTRDATKSCWLGVLLSPAGGTLNSMLALMPSGLRGMSRLTMSSSMAPSTRHSMSAAPAPSGSMPMSIAH